MFKKLPLIAVFSLFVCFATYAQSGTVTGTVTDAKTNEPMPAVTVQIVELSAGTATNIDGEYTISNVPAGTYTLKATFIGYRESSTQVTVTSGQNVLDITLAEDVFGLDELVVTGVGVGTDSKKLGFAISRIDEKSLQAVPASDPGNALRAKVPGVTIVQSSGDPLASPDIRLRGSTTINGSQEPLIIIDGVITDGSLRDINMADVQSMEVVKGAAGASLYGSLAGNGVIQIITKRGGDKIGVPRVTVRSEYGFSEIADDYPVATKHPFINDPVLSANGSVDTWAGYGNYDADRRFDNDFPVTYDNVSTVFTSNPFNTNYVSIAGSEAEYNYVASFENFTQGGVVKNLDSYDRNSFRLNADFVPNEKFSAQFSSSYVTVEAPRVEEQGQGDNFFYSVLSAQPFINLGEKNDDGTFSNDPAGYDIQDSNFENPLYVAENRDRALSRNRLLLGAKLEYQFTDEFTVSARQSLDRTETYRTTYYPVGYQEPGTPSVARENGSEFRSTQEFSTAITELWGTYQKSFEDINFTGIAKYLYEDRSYVDFDAFGHTFPANGIRNIGSLDPTTYDIDSFDSEERAENFFLNAIVDYQDKLIIDGLIRRDGSSRFGENERWHTYYRGSLAYRLTEDIDINNVQELKLRVSYGTSGQRPGFQDQYEIFTATPAGLTKNQLGNKDLKSSTIGEFEIGTNIAFLDRFSFEGNYAITKVQDDYLDVPLSSVAGGFRTQVRNIGEIENKSLEFALQALILSERDMNWTFNVTWDRTTQEITDLGDVPPYTRTLAAAALALFRVEEGQPYGAMYGNQIAGSLGELTVDDAGLVLNNGIDVNADGQLTVDDFEVNSHGYVVPKGTHGTADEQVTYVVDEAGEKSVQRIGNTNADFKMGFATNFDYKGLGLYVLVDLVQGGDVYNYTKQLLIFNDRHKDQQDFASQGFDVGYIDGASQIYNGGEGSSFYVEDASYIKLREVAVSYTIGSSLLGKVGDYIDEVKLSVSGRNLLTFTDYSGWDPEVALRTNATNFRLDEYAYPNFRTFTGSIQVRF